MCERVYATFEQFYSYGNVKTSAFVVLIFICVVVVVSGRATYGPFTCQQWQTFKKKYGYIRVVQRHWQNFFNLNKKENMYPKILKVAF